MKEKEKEKCQQCGNCHNKKERKVLSIISTGIQATRLGISNLKLFGQKQNGILGFLIIKFSGFLLAIWFVFHAFLHLFGICIGGSF